MLVTLDVAHAFIDGSRKMERITLLILGLVVWGCTTRPDARHSVEAAIPNVRKPEELDTAMHDAEGEWILTEFHESIIQRRAIGGYRLPIPVWTALLLRVDSSTVKCNGTLLPQTKEYSRSGRDTLLVLDAYGLQAFVYDAMEDRIQVFFKNDTDAKEGAMEYRRLSPEEYRLMVASMRSKGIACSGSKRTITRT